LLNESKRALTNSERGKGRISAELQLLYFFYVLVLFFLLNYEQGENFSKKDSNFIMGECTKVHVRGNAGVKNKVMVSAT